MHPCLAELLARLPVDDLRASVSDTAAACPGIGGRPGSAPRGRSLRSAARSPVDQARPGMRTGAPARGTPRPPRRAGSGHPGQPSSQRQARPPAKTAGARARTGGVSMTQPPGFYAIKMAGILEPGGQRG
jgi:hypothetical protein